MAFGIEEWFAFIIYYLPSLAYWILGTLVVGVLLFGAKKRRGERLGRRSIQNLALISTAAWMVYFITTAKSSYAITLLDSEENTTAEWSYRNLFDVGLNKAISLATSDQQEGNVRFYAACRIADLLARSNDQTTSHLINSGI